MFSPVFVNLCAVSYCLVGPNVPAWSAANPPSKTFLDTNMKVVLVLFYARVVRNVHFQVLGGIDLVVDLDLL